jgi:hypothetical protein
MRWPSLTELYSEMACLARRYHWSLDAVLDLEHADRRRFLLELHELEHA